MSGKTTLQLGVLAVILGSGIYLLDDYLERRQRVNVQVQRVFDLTVEPVSTIGFERHGQRVEFVRKGDLWFLQSPLRARANGPLVDRVVATLERLRRENRISREQRAPHGLKLADYGLAPPHTRIFMETGGGRTETLRLGDQAPFGGAVFAVVERNSEIFTLPDSVLNLFPDDLSAMRDRTIINGSPDHVERIDIHRRDAGFVQLVLQRDGWMLQQPLTARASSAAVRTLLEAVFAMQVTTFHWDGESIENPDNETAARMEMELRGQIEASGLAADAARLRLTVWTDDDRLGQEIFIGHRVPGPDGDSVFVRKGGVDAVYRVPASILEAGAVPVDTLRDRAIFHFPAVEGGRARARQGEIGLIRLQAGESLLELQRRASGEWHILTPVRAPADAEAVNALMAHLLKLRVKDYLPMTADELPPAGADGPLVRIALAALPPVPAGASEGLSSERAVPEADLLLAPPVPDRDERLARTTGRDEWFLLENEATEGLDASLVSPLRFRNRLVLAVDTDSVFRIQRVSPTGTMLVERSGTLAAPGPWRCRDDRETGADALQTVDKTALGDLLSAAARIEAARFVAFMPPDLEPFGLATPAASITFGFRGEGAIQNTILLGHAADDAWVHAMVQGRDFVFLMASPLAARLLQPLCHRPAVAAPEATDGGPPPIPPGEKVPVVHGESIGPTVEYQTMNQTRDRGYE